MAARFISVFLSVVLAISASFVGVSQLELFSPSGPRVPIPLIHPCVEMTVRWPRPASCDLNVGKLEVLALEQKGLPRCFRKRIGEAVAEVQPRRVVALAKSPPSPARGLRMGRGDRLQLNRRFFQECIKLMAGGGAAATLKDDCCFQKGSYRHASGRCHRDGSGIALRVRLVEQDRQDRRRVDDHLGSPRSS